MRLNWLVIGVGDITTKRVLPAILEESRSTLCGIVTRTAAKAEPWGVPAWESLDRALAESGCDAVYVASPVALHAPQTIASLRAGKHVLCEKPVAMNYAEAQSMAETARQTGRTLGIAYYRRMYPAVNRAMELLRQGVIGQPVTAFASSHMWIHPVDGFRGWLIQPELAGGGPLYDIASHRIDLMNYLFGNPLRATGLISNTVNDTAVEDNATVLIEHASGVRSVIDVRWHSRVERDEFRIRGVEGEIELSPLNSGILRSPAGDEHLPPHRNLHFPCVEDFVSAVLDQRHPRSSGDSAILVDWVTGEVMKERATAAEMPRHISSANS